MHPIEFQRESQHGVKIEPRWKNAAVPAALLVTTFLAYAGTLSFGFVFDDNAGILRNESIQSWRYVPRYFNSHVWSYLYPHLLSNYYRPLFLLWLRLNHAAFGLHPWGWHLTSVALHLGVTYLVYRLGLRLTRDVWMASSAALVFGLHPVHIEAVAYVSAVPELLCTLLMLGSLLVWLGARDVQPPRTRLALSLALYASALLAKESAMMLPAFVALYAGLHPENDGGERGFPKRLLRAVASLAPFLAVTLAYVPLRVLALKGFAHTVTPVGLRTEVLTIPSVLTFYLRLLIWPLRLSCYYDMPYVSEFGFREFVVPLFATVLAVAGLAAWYVSTRHWSRAEARILSYTGLWTALALLPVLNFRLLPEGEIAHDRYLYLPSVGFSILLALALRQVFHFRGAAHRRAWTAGSAVFICVGLGYSTVRQSLYWADDLSLYYRAYQIAPGNVSATTSLAAALARRGMVGPAMDLYRQALAVRPQFWRADVNLAYLYYQKGNYPESARYFARACAADPTDGDQFLYWGMALLRQGKLGEAENAVRTALIVRPLGKQYHLGLGMVLKAERKFEEARRETESELARDPENAQARALLEGLTAQTRGLSDELAKHSTVQNSR